MSLNKKNIVCIACSVLKKEIDKIMFENKLDFEIHYLNSMLHLHPEKLKEKIDDLINKNKTEDNVINLIYGECHGYFPDYKNVENVLIQNAHNCIELVLGSEVYKRFRKEGMFFLMPEWTLRWKEVFAFELGLSIENARALMKESHSKLLYIDTGILPIPVQILDRISDYTGLAYSVYNANLDNLISILENNREVKC